LAALYFGSTGVRRSGESHGLLRGIKAFALFALCRIMPSMKTSIFSVIILVCLTTGVFAGPQEETFNNTFSSTQENFNAFGKPVGTVTNASVNITNSVPIPNGILSQFVIPKEWTLLEGPISTTSAHGATYHTLYFKDPSSNIFIVSIPEGCPYGPYNVTMIRKKTKR